jgi:hypothetical protein
MSVSLPVSGGIYLAAISGQGSPFLISEKPI